MTQDLFGTAGGSGVSVPLPGAELTLFQGFLLPKAADDHYAGLLQETPWRQERVFVWGKWHEPPRLIAWYGDAGAAYTYSGKVNTPLAWTPRLLQLRREMERACRVRFNSVLLNFYRNGNDSMGWHSDDEPELGSRPVIGSLSLGATRELLFRHKTNESMGTQRISLSHGSLLVMAGDIQKNWRHAVNKDLREAQARVNLTFRFIDTEKRWTDNGAIKGPP
jgi:alkylated DNA repair dioxygenase AlkB